MSDDQTQMTKDDTQPARTTRRMERTERPDDGPDREDENGGRQWPFGYLLLWLLAVTSLLMNVVMMRQLLLARQAARSAVSEVLTVLDNLQGTSLNYEVTVDQILQIETDLPVDETIPVVIDQNLPIDTTVQATVNAGPLGQIPLNVPIVANVPVYIEQDLHIDQPFAVSMAVPVNFTIPIDIELADTPFSATIDEVKARLEQTQADLDKPLVPLPGLRGE